MTLAAPSVPFMMAVLFGGGGAGIIGGATYAITDIWSSPLEHRDTRALLELMKSEDKVPVESIKDLAESIENVVSEFEVAEVL